MKSENPSQGAPQPATNALIANIKDTFQKVEPRPSTPKNFRYASVNVYNDLEDAMDISAKTREELFNRKYPIRRKIMRVLKMNEVWFFLLILGFACAVVALSADTVIDSLIKTRLSWSSWEAAGFAGNFAIYTIYGLFFGLLAGVCVHEVCPHAAGAGVPAMKSVLSGLVLHQYLSLRCLVAKLIGIVSCYGAGLAVGKEGPYIHICGMIAYQLTKIPFFSKIRNNAGLKIQMLAAGCATGVVVTFGAPVGGVLFAIEITTTYYLTQNLWKQFFCAISAFLLVKVLGAGGRDALFSTKFDSTIGNNYNYLEVLSFIIIGVIYGLWGALWVTVMQQLSQFRKRYRIFQVKYLQVFVVTLVTCLISFPLEPLRSGYGPIINSMFSSKPLNDWAYPNIFFNLIAYTIGGFLLTCISVGLPVPCGVYTPLLVLGAVSGRLIGELIAAAFPSVGVIPGGYAVMGAAALCGGVTRTIASSIIVFEVTGDMTHLLPVLIATLIACAVGNILNVNVYDMMLKEKGLPYMPAFRNDKSLKITTTELMRVNIVTVTGSTTFADLKNILSSTKFNDYPLVDNQTSKILMGQFQRQTLTEMLFDHEQRFQQLLEQLRGNNNNNKEQQEQPQEGEYDEQAIIDELTRTSTDSNPPTENNNTNVNNNDNDNISNVGGDVVGGLIKRAGSKIIMELPLKSLTTSGIMKLQKKLGSHHSKVVEQETQRLRTEFFSASADLGRWVPALSKSAQPQPEIPEESKTRISTEEMDQNTRWRGGFDPCPFTVLESTPLSKVHFMFAVLGLSHSWVVRHGRLIGVITKKDLMQYA